MSEISVEQVDAKELDRWLALTTSVRSDRAGTVDDYLDWRRQAEDMAWFMALRAGVEVGAGMAYVGWHSVPGTGVAEAYVPAAHRGAGIGSALYRNLACWLSERGCVTLETTVREEDEASLGWAVDHGFREVARNSRLSLDLGGIDAPEIDAPPGVQIVTWAERPDLIRGIYAVACEAYPDVPGGENVPMEPFERWLSQDMQGDRDRPEMTFVALTDEGVVGYAKLCLSSSRENGIIHDMTGVLRAHRGRGIAAALKRAEIRWAKLAGFGFMETVNDALAEPIRRLNERHGYRMTPGEIVLHGSLAGIE
jgi:GNAT superfamily N-acetyltransferase